MRGKLRWAVVVLGLVLGFSAAAKAEGSDGRDAAGVDRVFAPMGAAGANAVGLAGKVVHRFTPPVASPVSPAVQTIPDALTRGPLIRPCDSPGSGCRNPVSPSTAVGVPPIGPGGRPSTPGAP